MSLDRKFGLKLYKILIDNHYKTIFGSVRMACSSCTVWLFYAGQVQDYHGLFQFCKKTKKEKARDAWATKVRPKLNLMKADIGDVSELAQQRRAMMMMEF